VFALGQFNAAASDCQRAPIGYAVSLIMNHLRKAFPLILATLLLSTACRGKHNRVAVENEEPEGGPRIASSLKMSDPAATQQLLKGFYGLEGGSWRWTAGHFSALLRPPIASPQRGATLTLTISIPPVVIEKLSSVTLTASVAGTKLKSETYSKPGSYTFTADVPPDLLVKEAITADFELDKSIPASPADQRELGVIATGVGLESK
jgi:hypothetical protein